MNIINLLLLYKTKTI